MTGPLEGVRVVELGAVGPAPFAGMLFADMGAEVVRVARLGRSDTASSPTAHAVLNRGRRWIELDLTRPQAREVVRRLVADADVFTEGFRPGVTERLGLGPDDLLTINPHLVYGRMTGWGQSGPRASSAGHDLGYLALSGALAPCVARDGTPTAPLNMLGDFGGGGMLLAVGVLAALWSAARTGKGQVVDAAIVDGAALLTGMHQAMLASGMWSQPAGHNLFDGGAPFYGVYRTADDRWLSVAAIEPKFYAALLAGLEVDVDAQQQLDASAWPDTRERFAARIATRTREEWVERFAGLDACVAPVLEPDEAERDAHLAQRGVYREHDGVRHPAPAPRFAATPSELPTTTGSDETLTVLTELGYTADELAALAEAGAVAPEPGDQRGTP